MPCASASFLNWSSQAAKLPVLRQVAAGAAIDDVVAASRSTVAVVTCRSNTFIGASPGFESGALSRKNREAPLSRMTSLLEHDLFRKPVSTFRDHALTSAR